MNNIIIKEVFNVEQINFINKLLDDNKDKILLDEPQLGRTRYNISRNDLHKSIVERLEEISKKFNTNLTFEGCYYSEYNLKYGKPELSIHTDQTVAVFTIDYQLDSNIEWEVFVEEESFLLKNNQAVTINVNKQPHWRPERIFSNGEYLKMIYFHFVDRTKPKPKILTKEEMKEFQIKYKHLWELKKNKNKNKDLTLGHTFGTFLNFNRYLVTDFLNDYTEYKVKSNYYFKDDYHYFSKTLMEVKNNVSDSDQIIEYKLNKEFFRSDNFKTDHQGLHILFNGCSETFGEASPIEDNWSYRVYNKITENYDASGYYNIAKPGASWEDIILNSHHYINSYGSPDLLIMLMPNLPRNYSFNIDKEEWEIDFKGIEDKNQKEYFYLYSDLFVSKITSLYNFIKYCESINTKVLWSTWSFPENKDILQTKLFDDSFIEIKTFKVNTIPDKLDKYAIERRDKLHRGNMFHEYIANNFLLNIENSLKESYDKKNN